MTASSGGDGLIDVYPAQGRGWAARFSFLDAAAAALFALATLSFGSPTASIELDLSWTQVLADSIATGRQWGTDIVFTFGPLGFLYPSTGYDARTYSIFVAGQLIFAAMLAVLAANAASHLRPAWRVALWGLALLALWRAAGDVSYFAMFVFASLPILRRGGLAPIVLATSPPLLAAIALIKFSTIPLLVGWSLVAIVALVLQRRVLAAAWIALGVPTAFVALWLAAGQALQNLPSYLATSAELVAGYGGAMGIAPRPTVTLAGIASLGAVVMLALMYAWRSRRDASHVLFAGFVLGATLLAWKAGFTRADGHIALFFGPAALIVVLLAGQREERRRMPPAAAWLAFAMVASFALVTSVPGLASGGPLRERVTFALDVFARAGGNLVRLFALDRVRAEREAWRAELANRHAMPRTIAAGRSADLLIYEQGVVLLNAIEYRPRPVFQGYSAYTPALAELNRRHFAGGTAPDLVLLKLQTIDGRLAAQEDPLALLEILRRYRPSFVEKGFVVLARSADSGSTPRAQVDPADATVGEWITVPAGFDATTVALGIDLAPLGVGYAAVLREPILLIDLRDDQGGVTTRRLLRKSSAAGFLVDPLLEDNEDLVRWWYVGEARRIRALRVRTESPWQRAMLASAMTVGFASAAIERPRDVPDPSFHEFLHPGFFRTPVVRLGAIERIEVDGRIVSQVHPPAELEIALDAGTGELVMDYGVRAAAYDGTSGCTAMSGVAIRLLLRDASGERVLLDRTLRPASVPEDRGKQRLRERIVVSDGGQLVLATAGGPDGDTSCDWLYVERLSVTVPVE